MPTNPDTGAAELMSPSSIGQLNQTVNSVPDDYTGTTAVDWQRYLLRKGWGLGSSHAPSPPGYIAPPPVMIVVQNSTFGVKDGGVSVYRSVESELQRAVQGLVAVAPDWSNERVASHLAAIARDTDAWNGDADPGARLIPQLVARYVQVYRVAVTPV